MLAEQTHITRLISLLPRAPERDHVEQFLIDEQEDHGAFAKYADIQTVADLRRHGPKALTDRGMKSEDAVWLMGQIGGARRGRKRTPRNDVNV